MQDVGPKFRPDAKRRVGEMAFSATPKEGIQRGKLGFLHPLRRLQTLTGFSNGR